MRFRAILLVALLAAAVCAVHAAANANKPAAPTTATPQAAPAKPAEPSAASHADTAALVKEHVASALASQKEDILAAVIAREGAARSEIVAQIKKVQDELRSVVDTLKEKVESVLGDKHKDASANIQAQAAEAHQRTGLLEKTINELTSSISTLEGKIEKLRDGVEQKQHELVGMIKASAGNNEIVQSVRDRTKPLCDWYETNAAPTVRHWYTLAAKHTADLYHEVSTRGGPAAQELVQTSRVQVLKAQEQLHLQLQPLLQNASLSRDHQVLALLAIDIVIGLIVFFILVQVLRSLYRLCCRRSQRDEQNQGGPDKTERGAKKKKGTA